jgi:hypothetical protein
LVLPAAATFVYVLVSEAQAKPPNGTFITFDVPGCSRDISPIGINPEGTITGNCVIVANSNLVSVGFLRGRDGTSTIINVPGSTSTSVWAGELFTLVAGPPINPAGAITGFYSDPSGANRGFLRARDGTFATFDAPGAVNGTEFLCCITPAGAVVGIFFDANSAGHGFLRAPNGTFKAFDPLGSTFTSPTSINPQGAISGAYTDASGVTHGFLRAPNGTITTFDPPGSVAPFGTEPVGIRPRGAIVGNMQARTFFMAS